MSRIWETIAGIMNVRIESSPAFDQSPYGVFENGKQKVRPAQSQQTASHGFISENAAGVAKNLFI